MNTDNTMQSFLDDYTQAVLTGQAHAQDTLIEYDALTYDDATYNDARDLMMLVESLQGTLTPVTPNPQFKMRLQHELMQKRPNVILRWRFLPARVQMAAAGVVIGGFLLLLRGFFLGEGQSTRQKIKENVA
jgi:hypothetical protein